jgi:hypothetical protein
MWTFSCLHRQHRQRWNKNDQLICSSSGKISLVGIFILILLHYKNAKIYGK